MQDAWVVVVTSLGNYSGEAPLGALITGIVMNKARTRAARDGRVVSFSDMARSESGGPAVGPERSSPDGHLTERFSARPGRRG